MTDRKDALTELLAKIEAGHGNDPSDYLCLMLVNNSIAARNAYNGSLDAAKALHEAVLPGWINVDIIWSSTRLTSTWRVTMSDGRRVAKASNPGPARAWLIAILTALIAEEPKAQLNNTEV